MVQELLGRKPDVQLEAVGDGLRDRVAVNSLIITSAECSSSESRSTEVPVLFAFFNFSTENKPGIMDTAPIEAELNVLDGCIDGRALTGSTLREVRG